MTDTPHNHMTRDVKPRGECPRCDIGYLRAEPAVTIPTTRVASGYGDRLMARIKADANAYLQSNLEGQGRLEWAIFRRATPHNGEPFDTYRHHTKGQALSRIERMYPNTGDLLEPRARLVSEWVKA